MTFKDAVTAELAEAMRSRELVQLHVWEDEPDILLVGTIEHLDSQAVRVKLFDERGKDMGEAHYAITSFARLERGTRYLDNVRILQQHPERQGNGLRKQTLRVRGRFYRALMNARHEPLLVYLKTSDGERYLGWVTDLSREHVRLSTYLEDGTVPDGSVLLKLAHVEVLAVNTDACQDYQFLIAQRGSTTSAKGT